MRNTYPYLFCTLLALLALQSCKTASPDYTRLLQGYRHSIHHSDGTSTFYLSNEPSNSKKKSVSPYYWYSKNQLHQTTGDYHGKLLDGEFTQHDKGGHLKQKRYFHMGLKTSLWKTWDDQGTLLTEENYRLGQLQGSKRYYEKGQLSKKEHYKKGRLNGPSINFPTTDSIITAHYRNGKKVERIPLTKKISRIWKGKKR